MGDGPRVDVVLLQPVSPTMGTEPVAEGTEPVAEVRRGVLYHKTIEALQDEVYRARSKFPGNRFLLAALTEEVGELARAMLQRHPPEDIAIEALQVACVALRIVEEGDASFDDVTDEEAKS